MTLRTLHADFVARSLSSRSSPSVLFSLPFSFSLGRKLDICERPRNGDSAASFLRPREGAVVEGTVADALQALGEDDRGEGAVVEGIGTDALQALGEGDRGNGVPLVVITIILVPRYYLSVDEEVVPIVVRHHHRSGIGRMWDGERCGRSSLEER
jgi:hypothetical protein